IGGNLAAGQEGGFPWGSKCAGKRVWCAANVNKARAEIGTDIEAGPVIGIGRSDRDVRWRRNERRKVCSQCGRTTRNAQRNNTRQSFHKQFPDLSCPRSRASLRLNTRETNEVINGVARIA